MKRGIDWRTERAEVQQLVKFHCLVNYKFGFFSIINFVDDAYEKSENIAIIEKLRPLTKTAQWIILATHITICPEIFKLAGPHKTTPVAVLAPLYSKLQFFAIGSFESPRND